MYISINLAKFTQREKNQIESTTFCMEKRFIITYCLVYVSFQTFPLSLFPNPNIYVDVTLYKCEKYNNNNTNMNVWRIQKYIFDMY